MADSPARSTSGAPGGAERRACGVVHRTTSESLRLGELPPPSLSAATASAAPALQQHNPRKISSFQITSVTVGGRTSADAGEDSADDLDESHADDLSRVTDLDNETPSRSEDTFSRDDVFYNASASLSLGSAPVIPTSSQYGLAIVGQETEAGDMRAAPGGAIDTLDAKPQDTKEIQEHVRNERFKVVKIESTEPFRRGRWMCMDYLDHTTTQQSAPIVMNNNLDSTEGNALTSDSGVVMNDIQHDELACNNELTGKELQAPPSVLQLEQKPFVMVSPGQSLTQSMNLVQQQMPAPVSVQSPPLEMPQQMAGPTLQAGTQVVQQHAQSMTHITMQNVPPNHPPPSQPQPVQQMPQSFPQHQLQQVIAQSQGMPQMQQMAMHQQIPQQMQQIPNQAQMQQMSQHMAQNQMPNMQQMPQMSQMQTLQNQNQMQVQNQNQLQHMQMQQMQNQSNSQQMHQMQQAQITSMNQQAHHLQSQGQSMGSQQPQLQHMSSQAQLQAMQSQQVPNHMQQMQMSSQVNQMANPNQQIPQMQPQMHMTSQNAGGQQQVVPGLHPQMQQGMSGVQQQYNQAVNQQPNPQSMINPVIPSAQQNMVSQHNVSQYHSQQSQMSQQGQTLPQEVLGGIPTSHQGSAMASNLQSLPSQPPGSTLPSNLQGMNQQNTMHSMAQQPQSMPQGAIQMMTNAPQNMPMSLDANQGAMQHPVSETIYMQTANQMQMGQHMPQPQNMMSQQVPTSGQTQQHLPQQNQMGGLQYVMPQQQGMPSQAVSQANMQSVNQAQGNVQNMSQQLPAGKAGQGQPMMQGMVNQVQHPQNIPMSMQQSMQGAVHGVATSVVQSQTNMQPGMQAGMTMGSYGSQPGVGSMPQNVMPVMSHTNMNQPVGMQAQQMEVTQVISGTSSPVVSLAVSSGGYAMPANALDGQNFGSPVSAVVSHVVNSLVNSSVGLTACDSGAPDVNEASKAGDTGDGKDEGQLQLAPEDESISGLALALGGSAASSPAEQHEASASRPASPAGAPDRPHHTSASGTSAVAIDNKIEQAMDLVKSHLMFAVREEVEVLKERIAELMERITQLEVENTYLRAHASQDTLTQLPAPAAKPAALPPAGPPPPPS